MSGWSELVAKLAGTQSATASPQPLGNEQPVDLLDFSDDAEECAPPVEREEAQAEESIAPKGPERSAAVKRSADNPDSTEPPSKKRPAEPVQKAGPTVGELFSALQASVRPLDAEQIMTALRHAWQDTNTRSHLSSKEWLSLVEGLLSEVDWKGLDTVLHMARRENQSLLPEEWLPLIYQAASRLVRDPTAGSGGGERGPSIGSSPSSDGFKSGAFREHPSAFFAIGRQGGVQLGGRGRCWGRLRGYTFCCWVNLKRKSGESSGGGGEEMDEINARQLFRFGNTTTGARLECFLMDGSTGFSIMMRSRTNSKSSWSTCECPVAVVLNRWHFIVVSHAPPYSFLGKDKICVFVDGLQQKGALSVPFPSGSDMNDAVLGDSLQGLMGAPSLFEGGDVTPAEAANLCERTRVRVENPHIVGGGADDDDVDDEDDELTSGLGYGREDAADHQVSLLDKAKEGVSRTGLEVVGGSSGKKAKKMIFAFDPRASERGRCPELVIRGTKRGRKDALELTADDLDASKTSGGSASLQSLIEDEQEDDATLEGECEPQWESSVRRDAIELAGGAEALLLAVADAPTPVLGDALMLLGDALHADAHLRTAFLGMEGFGMIGREIRLRFYPNEDKLLEAKGVDAEEVPTDPYPAHESEGVVVQVALHMMRAAPAGTPMEREFFLAGLREILLDSRGSSSRALQSLRLVAGLAAEKPSWVREAVGMDGLLRFMLRLEPYPEAQEQLASEVIRPVWTSSLTSVDAEMIRLVTNEVASVLCFVSEQPSSVGSRALLREIIEQIRPKDMGNPLILRALAELGGISYLLRLGSFAERNVKNPKTGIIVKDPEPLPCLLASSATPPETRATMVELVGLILTQRAPASIPMDADNPTSMLVDAKPSDHDINVQLGALLGIMRSTDYIESSEVVLSSLIDYLPKPRGLFVWAPLATECKDIKGMARVAEALRKSAPFAKALLAQRGWAKCFVDSASLPGAMGAAAKSALVACISRADDGNALEGLVRTAPAAVWSETIRTLVEGSFEELAPNLLVRILWNARRKDLIFPTPQDRTSFVLKALAAGEFLRNSATSPYWQSIWFWILHVLPETGEVEIAAQCVKLVMSLTSKEFAKPTAENRRRVLQFLKLVGKASFEGPAGHMRAEACLGLVQTYSLTDDGSIERMAQEHLEHASTMQDAVKRIVEALPNVPMPPELTEVNAPWSDDAPVVEPQVWTAAKAVVSASLRLRQRLKALAVEDVKDRLALKVTDKVRNRRFDTRWSELRRLDGIQARALRAESMAWSVDETFCERGSRVRRRLVHMTEEAEDTMLKSVVSRNALFSHQDSAKKAQEKEASKQTASADKPEDSDWVKIGEELSRRTTVKGHSDLQGDDSNKPAEAEDKKPEPLASAPPSTATSSSSTSTKLSTGAAAKVRTMTLEEWVRRPPTSIRGEMEGRWIDADAGERIELYERAFMVRPSGEVPGRLVVSNFALYFDPDPPGAAGNYYKLDETSTSPTEKPSPFLVEVRQRWSVRGIQRVLLRRHRMLESGLELFLRGDACKSVFLRFQNVTDRYRTSAKVRNTVAEAIIEKLPRAARERSQRPRSGIRSLVEHATYAWRVGAMSNFDYLMELNMLAGRSLHDLCQYPVFPWVLSDYRSEEIDLDDPRNYRDLSKPMGALDPNRLEQFVERYNTFEDPAIPKFMFGSHYSTAAGVVVHFLVRMEPFRSLHVELHDNRYDVPDRLFTSVAQAWEASSASQDLGEVKELTPEFYYLPAAFENRGGIDLGVSQTGVRIGAVDLPTWAKKDSQVFVRTMRAALEGPVVSSNLHKWINLVFGFQQRGPNAVQANNVFYYLTYPGAVDLESINDVGMRSAVELQIAHFGQCPEQLEANRPWPEREYIPSKQNHFYVRPRSGVDVGFVVDQEVSTLQARVTNRKPITTVPADESNNDDGGGGGVLALREDGALVQLIRSVGEDAKANSGAGAMTSFAKGALRGVKSPCVWSADGTLMIFAGRAAQGTVELVALDAQRGEGVPLGRATLFAHDENVSALAYDDGLLVTGANDGAVRLWRVGRSSAFRTVTVWTEPRRFLRGHVIGQPIQCCAVERSMGVVATASARTGLLVHDTLSGSLLWRLKDWTTADRMCWDRPSGCLFVIFKDASMRVVSIDGAVLAQREGLGSDEGPIVCFERIAAGIIALARPSAVDLVRLPTLEVLQTWPLPDVCAITPPPERISPEYLQDEHVVVNLITTSRTVFVMRRSVPLATQSGFRLLREAPTAVAGVVSGVVSGAVSGATRGVTLVGALDNVRKGVEVSKGVASEVWDVFSAATGLNKQQQQQQ